MYRMNKGQACSCAWQMITAFTEYIARPTQKLRVALCKPYCGNLNVAFRGNSPSEELSSRSVTQCVFRQVNGDSKF